MYPLCPYSEDECVRLTNAVFDTFAHRDQAKRVLPLHLLLNPHIKCIPEDVRVEPSILVEAEGILRTNFISFDGRYSPPLLLNRLTGLSYELSPKNLSKNPSSRNEKNRVLT
jgi:hypothetical protein